MTPKQALRQLKIAHRELILVDNRLWKLSNKLQIPENTDLKNVIAQIQQLIEIGESKC
jgi:hypothetical protein